MRLERLAVFLLPLAVVFSFAVPAVAETSFESEARDALRRVYETRGDLQQLFDPGTWLPVGDPRTGDMKGLEDWARRYGYKEHSELWRHSPDSRPPDGYTAESSPRALAVREGLVPVRRPGAEFDFSSLTAGSALVVDEGTRRVLLELNPDGVVPTASVAKLMTALVTVGSGVGLETPVALSPEDEVGGARLAVPAGTSFSLRDLLYATLVGPANNAASAAARAVADDRESFVLRMNSLAGEMGLGGTSFSDPSGLSSGNVSTARDIAALTFEALDEDEIRRITTTSSRTLNHSSGTVTVRNTNELLTDPNNGLYVLGGKVGYLPGAGWNLAVRVRDAAGRMRPAVVVVLGAETDDALFAEAKRVLHWTWESYDWETASSVEAAGQSAEPLLAARAALKRVLDARADLRSLFDTETWVARPARQTSGLVDLEDWAVKYGYSEHPEISWYGTEDARGAVAALRGVSSEPRALRPAAGVRVPVLPEGRSFDFSRLTADAVFVVDAASRATLVARNADRRHPAASITKLMTATVAVSESLPMSKVVTMSSADEIGGARLRVPVGTGLTLRELMYCMLVGSANNSAHAIARASGFGIDGFVDRMNAKAREFGLANTVFTDPSGLDVGNTVTAREVAALAIEAFSHYDIRKMASTAEHTAMTDAGPHEIRNTNQLLTDEGNGLVVLGGKTGYLNESKWNLVVHMMDGRGKPIVVVVLGSDSKDLLFDDAEMVGRWVWDNYIW